MSHYIVTNITNSEVVLEDVGVRLAGRASSPVGVAEFEASSSVRDNHRFLSVRLVHTPIPSASVWPLSLKSPMEPPNHSNHSPKPDVKAEPVGASNAALHAKIDQLTALVASLVASKDQAVQSPTPSFIPQKSASSKPVEIQVPPEPVFIPSSIVPKDAEVQVKLNTSEKDRPDIGATTASLKEMRRKK